MFSELRKGARTLLILGFVCVSLAHARPIGPLREEPNAPKRPPGRFGDLATSSPFNAARYYAENSFFDEALAEYERVLAETIGGELEPTARLVLANEYANTIGFRPKNETYKATLIAKYVEQLDQVTQRFPGTTYAFVAKTMRFETMPASHFDLDPTLVAVGARPVAEILDDNPDPPFHERMIREEFRHHVAQAYSNLLTRLSEEEATKLQLFLIESFPYSDWYSEGKRHFRPPTIQPAMSIDALPPGMPTEPDSIPPSILSRFPEQGQSTGPLPDIRVTMVDGDYWARQPDSSTSRLKLDGVDVTELSFWKARFDTTGTEPNFQELTILYTPGLPLLPGEHTLELFASDGSVDANSQTYQWTFRVSLTPPPPTTETLPASKDALVYERGPHANEGANPRLTLEKITGKASRDLVGFDLANVDTSRLSKATLVLTIDSSQQVTGWGNGETVSVRPVTTPWQEGNGKKHGLPTSQQTSGSGAGATWFSPVDENIVNDFANSVVQWSGAATYQGQGSAAPQTVVNHQTGELRFDVTGDVMSGAQNGWLLRKDQENRGSKVSFYSKESAAAAGAPDLGPRLILEYESPSAQAGSSWPGWLGQSSIRPRLQAQELDSETVSFRRVLKSSPTAAFLGERALLLGVPPAAELGARLAYRSWLRGEAAMV